MVGVFLELHILDVLKVFWRLSGRGVVCVRIIAYCYSRFCCFICVHMPVHIICCWNVKQNLIIKLLITFHFRDTDANIRQVHDRSSQPGHLDPVTNLWTEAVLSEVMVSYNLFFNWLSPISIYKFIVDKDDKLYLQFESLWLRCILMIEFRLFVIVFHFYLCGQWWLLA